MHEAILPEKHVWVDYNEEVVSIDQECVYTQVDDELLVDRRDATWEVVWAKASELSIEEDQYPTTCYEDCRIHSETNDVILVSVW